MPLPARSSQDEPTRDLRTEPRSTITSSPRTAPIVALVDLHEHRPSWLTECRPVYTWRPYLGQMLDFANRRVHAGVRTVVSVAFPEASHCLGTWESVHCIDVHRALYQRFSEAQTIIRQTILVFLICPVGSPTMISNLPLMMSLIMLAGDPSSEPSGNKASTIAF